MHYTLQDLVSDLNDLVHLLLYCLYSSYLALDGVGCRADVGSGAGQTWGGIGAVHR